MAVSTNLDTGSNGLAWNDQRLPSVAPPDRLSALQVHQAIRPSSTHGRSERRTRNTTSTARAETAKRLVIAFASSVMNLQRGISGMGDGRTCTSKALRGWLASAAHHPLRHGCHLSHDRAVLADLARVVPTIWRSSQRGIGAALLRRGLI